MSELDMYILIFGAIWASPLVFLLLSFWIGMAWVDHKKKVRQREQR